MTGKFFASISRIGVAIALAVILASAAGAEDSAGKFVAGFEDLPLMPGLTQAAGSATVFDSPSGRVIESYAEGNVDKPAVMDFYAKTLPQLGWRQIAPYRFKREGEVLEITPKKAEKTLVRVRFYLSPG
jgi:hypothetical protein